MVDIGFIDKLNIIYEFLKNNSLIFLVLLLILMIILDLMYGKNKRETKVLYTVIIVLILVYMGFSYYKPLFNIIDVYIENIFRLTFFPSIIEYFTIVSVTILIQIISIKKCGKFVKNINVWVGILIEVLFIINIIAMNNITVDLNSVTSIYENDLLLSIFQVTGISFIIWIIFNVLTFIVSIFIKDRLEMPKLNNEYE